MIIISSKITIFQTKFDEKFENELPKPLFNAFEQEISKFRKHYVHHDDGHKEITNAITFQYKPIKPEYDA